MTAKLQIAMMFLVTAVTAVVSVASSAAPADDRDSPWTLELTDKGAAISYRGVPLVMPYGTNVVKPGWTGMIFRSTTGSFDTQRSDDGRTVTGVAENDDYRLQYELTELSPTRVRFAFQGELLRDQPATVEHGFGKFNANVLAGRPYRLTGPNMEPVTGRIPAHPASDEAKDTHLPSQLRAASFDSRIGRIDLRFDAPADVTFKDGRFGPAGWSRNYPAFWMGFNTRAQVGQPVRGVMTLAIDPKSPWQEGEAVSISPTTTPAAAAFVPEDHGLRVIPKPQSMTTGEGVLDLTGRAWRIAQPAGEDRLVRALRGILEEEFGSEPIGIDAESTDGQFVTLQVGDAAPVRDGDWQQSDEGYRLRITSGGLSITARTPRGAFYGLQTLAQLLKVESGGRITVPAVDIDDWPALRHRSVHWYPSIKGVPFHRKTIERILARYKINATVIQCEAAQWDSQPKIAVSNSIPKKDLIELVELCRQNFIDPIPLLNVPGHARWIFANGQNREIAEDPNALYAYSVKDPRSYEFIFSLMEEAIQIFKPKAFHVGHDEVTLAGRFPNPEHPLYEGESLNELMSMHLHRIRDWLAERDIETIVWSDMFLSEAEARGEFDDREETQRAREIRGMIPQDVIMADWHYSNWEQYPSLGVFEKLGFQTIACTWYRPDNIYYFTHAAAKAGSLGLMQTTWAGFFPDESTLERELRQFAAYILAAEYSWSLRDEKPQDLPYRADAVFTESYEGASHASQSGELVSLAEAVNVPRHDWQGLGTGYSLDQAPTGQHRFGEVLFDVPVDGAVVLGGPMAPADAAREVTMDLDGVTAAGVAVLHGAAWDVKPGVPVGQLTFVYADGSTAALDVTSGYTVAGWATTDAAMKAPIGWQGEADNGQPLTLRVTRWSNPHPDRRIDRLVLSAGDPSVAWLVAGLTLLQ